MVTLPSQQPATTTDYTDKMSTKKTLFAMMSIAFDQTDREIKDFCESVEYKEMTEEEVVAAVFRHSLSNYLVLSAVAAKQRLLTDEETDAVIVQWVKGFLAEEAS